MPGRNGGNRCSFIGAIGSLLLWAAIFVAAILTPGYSHFDDAISELGAIGAPYPWIINWIGILPFGVAVMITGVLVVRDFRGGVIPPATAVLLVLGGLGFALAGLMRCDVGCRASDLPSAALHGLGAGAGFLLLPAASFVFGLGALRRGPHRPVQAFSFIMALVMAANLALFLGVLDPTRELGGLWQRTTVLSISVWIGVLSIDLFRSAERGRLRSSANSTQLPRSAELLPKILAGFLVGVLVWKWDLVRIALRNPPWSLVGFMSLALVVLVIVTVVGLVRGREWGFWAAYVLVPFSTLFHSVPLVPWVTEALPTLRLRIWALFVMNALFLIAIIWAHSKYKRGWNG